ncbi:uncharacterized protein EDB93DRAFT_1161190 [Suillus bovinus]|uniref:uncharacterized protein n=1 Tax=Suillus bovinus TaxID=48563 RepID=UPI001B85DE72|nr:uncharacterized protein EDB93DRAFT_1161190 [Suillus bovinus]KAG2140951.1 hypothetical protein EDB93DRAFT_1161190 [Suillus bovinus]
MVRQEDENVVDNKKDNQIQKPQRTRRYDFSSIYRYPRSSSPSTAETSDAASEVPATLNDPVKSARRKRQVQSPSEAKPAKKRAKRARDENEISKHERFWLADGNVVLELDGIYFRVHQSWLTHHSKRIATSLLDKGISGDKIEQIKIALHGKLKAKDFETLLLLYDNPGNFRNAIEPRTLMSLIRAATGLGFDSDRVWLVRELEAHWPSNLEELTANPEPHLDAPEVAVLARMCNIDGLLRPAFYDMARVPGFGLDKFEESEQIGRADMLRLIRIREYLSEMWVQAAAREDPALVCQNLRGAPSSDSEETSTSSKNADEKPALISITSDSVSSTCLPLAARREAWARLVYDSGIFTQYRYDPLRGLAALMNIEWTNDWCKDCKEKRKKDWHIMQRSIWEKVGEYLRED